MVRFSHFCSLLLAVILTAAACEQQPSPTPPPASTAAPANTPPPATPAPAAAAKTYALPGESIFPEGVAYDPTTHSFFTGSTADGTVYRGRLDSGEVAVFSARGADERTAAIGMKVDSSKRRLWVAGGATGLVFVYNANTGALIRKYATPSSNQTFLNDVALASNGDAYVTDSRRPVLFKISGAASEPGELESWLDFTGTPVRFAAGSTAINGVVVSPDDAYIVVVHSTDQKLFRITVATKEVREVDLGGKAQGGDGMVLDGRTLYVLARTPADAIVRIDMSPDFSSGTIRDSFQDDSFAFPTTIAKVGNRMLVVNSQFNARGAGQTPKLPFAVSDIPIPP